MTNWTREVVHGGFNQNILHDKAFLKGTKSYGVDASKGGQFGFMVDIGSFINNTPYVGRDVIPVLMQYPKAYDLFDKDTRDTLVRMLKSLIEVNAKSITGLRSTLQTEWMSVEVGGAGEIQQELTNVTRERSAPNYTWHEVDGCAIGRFWEWNIEMLGMSANSKYPAIIAEGFNAKVTTFLADMTRFVTLYIEPDRTGQYVVDAYLCANMFPQGAGDRESMRELTSAKQGRDITIEFTALTQRGYGVIALAQKMLDAIKYSGANPQYQPAAVDKVDSNISAMKSGYTDQIHRLGGQAITL